MTTTVFLNADQDEIRGVARRFLAEAYGSERLRALIESDAGSDPEDWHRIVGLGWTAIALGEEHGGVGFALPERCLLLEEMGRVLLPGPYFSSAVLAADVVSEVASGARRDELLTAIGDGSCLATVVAHGDMLAAPEPAGQVVATVTNGGHVLHGRGGLTLDGASADVLLVLAADGPGGEPGLFRVDADAPGLAREPVEVIDATRRFASIGFDGARAERLDLDVDTRSALERALGRATVSLTAEMVGGARACVDMTVEYLKDRRQFGVPIGSFQALKHRCADLAVTVDSARETVLLAADTISGDQPPEMVAATVSAAKVAACRAYSGAAAEAIQLHGGIGFTWEHDAHLYYRRAHLSCRLLGGVDDHHERLARQLDA